MFVSTQSSTLLTLLLLMSTLQPYLLLTEQSSLISRLKRPMEALNLSLITTNSPPPGLLGEPFTDGADTLTSIPPEVLSCQDSIQTNPASQSLAVKCLDLQAPFLLNNVSDEYQMREFVCKARLSGCYCDNLVARTYCTAEYDAVHKFVQQFMASSVEGECNPWANWAPPLDSPPLVTPEITQCDDALARNQAGEMCKKEVADSMAKQQIKDLTEEVCKTVFEGRKCVIKVVCKYCHSPDKYLNFNASVWSLSKVTCTKWAKDEPKMECPSSVLLIVGIVIAVIVVILVVIGLVICCVCFVSSNKSAGGRSSSKGRAGSKRVRKRNSRKGRSSISAKKSSRASSRAKPTSRASMRAKPGSRASSRVKHSKGSRF